MLSKLMNLSILTKKISLTFSRFSIVSICIILATLLLLLSNHEIELFSKEIHFDIFKSLMMLIVPFTALKLYKEQKNISILVYFLLLVILSFYIIYNVLYYEFNLIFIALASISALIFSAYLFTKNTNKDLLLFLWDGLSSISFALIASIAFVLGLVAILGTIDYLFDLDMDDVLFVDISIIGFIGLFSLLVLAGISKNFSYENINISASKMLNLLVKYILLPLLFIYMVILYLYFFKIIFEGELPKGNLASMIISFGVIGIILKLMVFFLRDSNSKLVNFFDKYYFHFMLVPIGMLCVSLFRRISDYGITESRYAIGLFILWFLFITIFSIIKKHNFNFKYIFTSMAFLLIVSTIHPVSALSLSANSQMDRLKNFLVENKLLVDGKIIKAKYRLPFPDTVEFTSLIKYLATNQVALNELNIMLSDIAQEKNVEEFTSARNIIDAVGILYATKWMHEDSAYQNAIKYKLTQSFISPKGYDYLTFFNTHRGNEHIYAYVNKSNKEVTLKLSFLKSILKLDFQNGSKIEFDLMKLSNELVKKDIKEITKENEDEVTLIAYSKDKKYKAKLVVNYMYQYRKNINTLEAYIMFNELVRKR